MVGIEPATAGSRARRANHCAMLPRREGNHKGGGQYQAVAAHVLNFGAQAFT